MFVGLQSFFESGEGDISPGSSGDDGGVYIEDVPLRSLTLDEFFEFLCEDFWVFFGVGFDSLQVENVGLVFLGILVDLTFSIVREDRVVIDAVRNVVQDDFVLVFTFSHVG